MTAAPKSVQLQVTASAALAMMRQDDIRHLIASTIGTHPTFRSTMSCTTSSIGVSGRAVVSCCTGHQVADRDLVHAANRSVSIRSFEDASTSTVRSAVSSPTATLDEQHRLVGIITQKNALRELVSRLAP